jgi:formimidoylglutamate deiminase
MARTAVRDVVVNGRVVVEQRRHALQDEIVEAFGKVQRQLGASL